MWAFNPKRTTRMHSSHSVVNIKINMKEPIPKTRPNLPGNHRLSPKTAKERKLYEQKQWDIYILKTFRDYLPLQASKYSFNTL